MSACPVCCGERWVCENHRDTPWFSQTGCPKCGGAGAPCPACNQPAPGDTPALPPGFIVDQHLERYRNWLLPLAGGLGFALAAFILWCLWKVVVAFDL
jgi:hypothetical protein